MRFDNSVTSFMILDWPRALIKRLLPSGQMKINRRHRFKSVFRENEV